MQPGALINRALVVAATLGLLAAACGGSSSGGGKRVEVRLTDKGCEPADLQVAAGKTTFHVTNSGAAGVTEFEILDGNRVVGEIENIIEGISRSFTVDLQPGEYVTYCPGGSSSEKGTLLVSGEPEQASTPSGPSTSINVTERDYAIDMGRDSVPSGSFTFTILNEGPTTHEFVIIKTDLKADSLPLEDSEVKEDDPRLKRIDEIEDLEQGKSASFSVSLDPGHYVFICNIPAHYGLGMHTDFTVS